MSDFVQFGKLAEKLENTVFVRPEIMIPALILLIIFCTILLILLQKEKPGKEIINNNHSEEDEVYKRMYGDHSPAYSREAEEIPQKPSGVRAAISSKKDGFRPPPGEGESYLSAVLVMKEGQNSGNKYFLDKDAVVIGSDPENDIVVWDKTVSGKHARIREIDGRFVLFDEVSDRGVILNGKKLLRPKVLYDFDEIRLGKTCFIFRGK